MFQEVPHAAGFLSLRSDEAYLASDVISILEAGDHSFIECGICFEPRDAIFDYVTKPPTNFEMIGYLQASAMGVHRKLPSLILEKAALVDQLSQPRQC